MTRLARLLRLLKLYELETDPLRRHWCGLRILRTGSLSFRALSHNRQQIDLDPLALGTRRVHIRLVQQGTGETKMSNNSSKPHPSYNTRSPEDAEIGQQMVVRTSRIKTYKSDGSDGYDQGTYGVMVSGVYSEGTTWASSDGGFPSREMAQERGERLARNLEASE